MNYVFIHIVVKHPYVISHFLTFYKIVNSKTYVVSSDAVNKYKIPLSSYFICL